MGGAGFFRWVIVRGRSCYDRTPWAQADCVVKAESNDTVQHRSLILRIIYALCLIGATYNHWAAILQHGLLWDYGGFPKASTLFWTTLAFLDPATAILLFMRPNAGVAATAAIIIADVIHNSWIQARYFPPLLRALADAPQVIEQIAFMVFVMTTAPLAWAARQRAIIRT